MYELTADHQVAIIGAGIAGMSTALMLARARIDVCVIGDPDRAFYAGPTHNFLTHDGRSKQAILAAAAADVDAYPSVTRINSEVVAVDKDAIGYGLRLANGGELTARRLVFAPGFRYPSGITGIDGLDPRFGQDVLTCPYCHAYELSDLRLVLIGTGERDRDFFRLLSNWTADLHYITHDGPSAAEMDAVVGRVSQGRIVDGRVRAIEGEIGRPVLKLDDGTEVEARAIYMADLPGSASWPIIDALGIERGLHPMTGKAIYKTDQAGRTDLGDVFIIGDARTGFSTLVGAAHEGIIAGFMLANDIIEERTKGATAAPI